MFVFVILVDMLNRISKSVRETVFGHFKGTRTLVNVNVNVNVYVIGHSPSGLFRSIVNK